MINEIKSKALDLEGKIVSAEIRLADCRSKLAEVHLNHGDIQRANADAKAAQIDLDALHEAFAALKSRLADAEAEETKKIIEQRRKKIERLTKTHRTAINKSEEHLHSMMAELEKSTNALAEIRHLASLTGNEPGGFAELANLLRDPNPPVAIAAAVIIAQSNRVFAEHLGRALSNHRTAEIQCASRSMAEMAINPIDMVSA